MQADHVAQYGLELLAPSEEYADETAAFRQDFLDAGDHMDGCGALRKTADPMEYIRQSRLRANPSTASAAVGSHARQWICVRKGDHRIVGMCQYRYQADEAFRIGYCVRPGERQKGYATWMLRRILIFCKGMDMKEVIIACEQTNEASRKVITKCGGIFVESFFLQNIALEKYRIPL